jgi:hypothetical protein
MAQYRAYVGRSQPFGAGGKGAGRDRRPEARYRAYAYRPANTTGAAIGLTLRDGGTDPYRSSTPSMISGMERLISVMALFKDGAAEGQPLLGVKPGTSLPGIRR